ncbi:hypothetical protein [Sandaracinus amylolyticus]|uniref:hypothetical protein n=1 Tax=Sandaracinus amylolyticus TaxID=927083 RepID=UPI001F2A9208|nr:hypothetical protein [Sandaracinus amylolyticus]
MSGNLASTKTRRPITSAAFPALTLDQRGAIMVIGVFMSAMLVGILYYVWGIGGALLFRERMQDAADASAFSAAVVHARGMNIIALLNIVMAALAAVETGLQVAAEMLDAAAIAAGLTCLGCGPWCAYCCEGCYYAIKYGTDASSAHNIHNQVERIIDPIMTATHGVAVAVRHGSPLAAQGLVIGYSTSRPYNPPVELGVMFPLFPELQAEDHDGDWPCDNKVRWPALGIAELVAPIHADFDIFNPWYGAGALYGLARITSAAREWCPDYFQRVTDGSELGESPFQIRTLMYGNSPFGWTRHGVAVAAWDTEQTGSGVYDTLDYATRVGFAQSEYFYEQPFEGDHEREEWTWHQRWRARLRRFRLGGGGADGCSIPGCSALGELQNVVVH